VFLIGKFPERQKLDWREKGEVLFGGYRTVFGNSGDGSKREYN
jgi:hypothetical protein